MKKFEREDPDSPFYHEDTPEEAKRLGTPFSKYRDDFSDFISDVPGFEPDADKYVYAIVLMRSLDDSIWYYVGETDELKRRLSGHAGNFSMARVGVQHGEEVLAGDGGTLHVRGNDYRMIGVERVHPIYYDDINFDEDSLGPHDNPEVMWDSHRIAYVNEQERRISYEIAVDNETTNVLGGR